MSAPTDAPNMQVLLASIFGAARTTLAPAAVLLALFTLMTGVVLWNWWRSRMRVFFDLIVFCAIRLIALGLRIGVAKTDGFEEYLYIVAAVSLSVGYIILVRFVLHLEHPYLRALFPDPFSRRPLSMIPFLLALLVVAFLAISIAGSVLQITDLLDFDVDKALGIDKNLRWAGTAGVMAIVGLPILGGIIVGMIRATTLYQRGATSRATLYPGIVLLAFTILLVLRVVFSFEQIANPTSSEAKILSFSLIPEVIIVIVFQFPYVHSMWSSEKLSSYIPAQTAAAAAATTTTSTAVNSVLEQPKAEV